MSEVRQSWQRCDACAAEYDERDAAPRCRACGGLLAIVHTAPLGDARAIRARFDAACCARPSRTASGVWRFAEVVLPTAAHVAVTHPEGNTPLITRTALDAFAGVDELLLKHEGHNPTGSFKDRGMTMAITDAKARGQRAVLCASTGNTSASAAAYAAKAKMKDMPKK